MKKRRGLFAGFGGTLLCTALLMSACSQQKLENAETGVKESKEASLTETEKQSETETAPKKETEDINVAGENEKKPEDPKILKNLGMDPSILSETYYKAGDVNSYISMFPDYEGSQDMFASDSIYISFRKGYDAVTESYGGSAILVTEEGKTEYRVPCEFYGSRLTDSVAGYMEASGEMLQGEAVISFEQDDEVGTVICVGGAVPFAGEYYKGSCIKDLEVRQRFFYRAELEGMSSEKLALLRNTVYALHGRKFKDKKLQDHFERQPWYRGMVEPEQFSEAVFSDMERANLELIQKLEKEGMHRDADDMEPAPYLELLERGAASDEEAEGLLECKVSWETAVTVDMKNARDMGSFWEAEGEISLPVTMTRKQWKEVQDGGSVLLTSNELTGEKRFLSYKEGVGYLYYKEGEEPMEWAGDIMVHYDYDTGLYQLSQLSDDTVMKPVYKGTLRIAKGAVFGGHVTAALASQGAAEILPADLEGWEDYGGNYIVYDPAGCILALYYLGD